MNGLIYSNIKNYQNDKSVKSIIMWSNANIDSSVLNYKDIEIKDKQIIIKNIPPSYDGTIVVDNTANPFGKS